MSSESLDESSRFVIPRSQWPQVLLVAVALPVFLALVNDWIVARLTIRMPMSVVVVVFAIYIAEMTVIAVAAGAGIRQTWLAWMLFAWLLLLIDLNLIVAAVGQSSTWSSPRDLSIAAFAAA